MSRSPVISRAMEDYLKAIFELHSVHARVSTSQLADRLRCSPASVTNMVQRLAALQLVSYEPYRGVTLSPTGEKVALEILRHHRLIELYLAEVLGYDWDRVHSEAEALEHVISEEFETRIDAALGHPRRDPHGSPIPTLDGRIERGSTSSLWEAAAGCHQVEWIDDRCSQTLRQLAGFGIYPQVEIELLSRRTLGGAVQVRVSDQEVDLSEEVARQVYLRDEAD